MTQPNVGVVEGPLNQFVVQWDVDAAFTGLASDPAPGLATAGGLLLPGQRDEDGVYRIVTSDPIGIIDPDALGALGGSGDRYMQWFRVEFANGVIPVSFAVRVVDASGLVPGLGDTIILQDVTAGAVFATTHFYYSQMIFIPQGAAIQVTGLPAPTGDRINRIKIGFRSATSGREDAMLQQSMCCQSGA